MFNKQIKIKNDYIYLSYKDIVISFLVLFIVSAFFPMPFVVKCIASSIFLFLEIMLVCLVKCKFEKSTNVQLKHTLLNLYSTFNELDKNLSVDTYNLFKKEVIETIPNTKEIRQILQTVSQNEKHDVFSSTFKRIVSAIFNTVFSNIIAVFGGIVLVMEFFKIEMIKNDEYVVLALSIIIASKICENVFKQNELYKKDNVAERNRMIKLILKILDEENNNKNTHKNNKSIVMVKKCSHKNKLLTYSMKKSQIN